MKRIGLIDCNNFFVSCERLFRPDLRNHPVVVLSSNDGCVVSRSQEAKALNIPMGVPVFKIKDIIKDNNVAVFSSNFTLYRDISSRVMQVLRSEIATIEQYSVDESFFELPHEEATLLRLRAVKDRVEQETGIPVSLGLGGSKTQAKIAAAEAKRGGGVFVLEEEWWQSVIGSFPMSQVWGVGPGLSRRLSAAGLTTVGAFVNAERMRVEKLFGVVGLRLQAELSGVSAYPVEVRRVLQKSIMSSRSFAQVQTEKEQVFAALAYHLNQVLEDVRGMDAKALGCGIYARPSRFSDYAFQGIREDIVLDIPSDDPHHWLPLMREAFERSFIADIPYKKAGVTLFGITPNAGAVPLFAAPDTSALLHTVDGLNEKFGQGTISFFGSRLGDTHTARKHASPRYTTDWNDIPTIHAK